LRSWEWWHVPIILVLGLWGRRNKGLRSA
jgi:hypothetical protein